MTSLFGMGTTRFTDGLRMGDSKDSLHFTNNSLLIYENVKTIYQFTILSSWLLIYINKNNFSI